MGDWRPIAMPVAVHICPEKMTRDDYNKTIDELEASGRKEPEGRMFHCAYGNENVSVFEVWQSEEDFEAHRDRYFAILQGVGVDAGTVDVHEIHSDIPD
jgi:hypothetical protein